MYAGLYSVYFRQLDVPRVNEFQIVKYYIENYLVFGMVEKYQ